MARHWSLLFITDLHYESADSNYTDDPKELEQRGYRDPIFPRILNILEYGFPRAHDGTEPFDLIAIGGDITTHGKPEGFKKFEREAMPLLKNLVKKSDSICLVHGNHDVEWGLRPTDKGSFGRKFGLFKDLVQNTKTTSCLFPEGELETDEDGKLSFLASESGPFYVSEERKLLVVCVNSSIRCGELNTKMDREIADSAREAEKTLQKLATLLKLTNPPADLAIVQRSLSTINEKISKYLIRDVSHVTASQLDKLTSGLNALKNKYPDDWGCYFKVAILHHPLIHFSNQITEHKSYELMVDSSAMLSWLASYDFDLVLTGHKHQPFQEHYNVGGKKILLVGGPTVAGYPSGDSWRGLRWIEATEEEESRVINIFDVPQNFGLGNARGNLDPLREKPSHSEKVPSPSGAALQKRIKQLGYFYREMASVTVISEDGDARRTVEYEDLKIINKECPRKDGHTIQLPYTSGYLDLLQAKGKDFAVSIQGSSIPANKPAFSTYLKFEQEFPFESTVSYFYEWYAVNGFAKDERQFDYKYGDRTVLDNIEFTHFTTDDPVEELTVLVQFPSKYKISEPPRLRIVHVDNATQDVRNWRTNTEVERSLTTAHALRYYESMKVAAVRIKNPDPQLSYGIQWKVAPAPAIDQEETDKIRELRECFVAGPTSLDHRTELLRTLKEIIDAARKVFMPEWKGEIDISLMYFDGSRLLRILSAASHDSALSNQSGFKEMSYTASMPYGYGIAGRAFKSNGLRCYVSPEKSYAHKELNYYRALPGSPVHKVLVSWPLHVPVSNDNFDEKNDIYYEERMPYAVLNLGSEDFSCPLKNLRVPESNPSAKQFQHEANWLIYKRLSSIFLDKNVTQP